MLTVYKRQSHRYI